MARAAQKSQVAAKPAPPADGPTPAAKAAPEGAAPTPPARSFDFAAARSLQIRTSRDTLRRAGFVFGRADWTEVPADELGPDQVLALLAEPALTIRGVTGDGAIVPLPGDLRAELMEALRDHLADAD